MQVAQCTYNLLEMMPSAALVLSVETKKIIFANDACQQAFAFGTGDTVEEIVADTSEVLAPEELDNSIRVQLQL